MQQQNEQDEFGNPNAPDAGFGDKNAESETTEKDEKSKKGLKGKVFGAAKKNLLSRKGPTLDELE